MNHYYFTSCNLQVQATVVGSLAAFAAVILGWVLDGEFNIHHATLLCASSLVTATLASLILGSVMAAVVVCSRKCNVNPDNVATPIAASLGDLTTLALLSAISRFLHSCLGKLKNNCIHSLLFVEYIGQELRKALLCFHQLILIQKLQAGHKCWVL